MLSIRTRNVLMVSALILIVVIAGGTSAYFALIYSLKSESKAQLLVDARGIYENYNTSTPSSARPTGGIWADFYTPNSLERVVPGQYNDPKTSKPLTFPALPKDIVAKRSNNNPKNLEVFERYTYDKITGKRTTYLLVLNYVKTLGLIIAVHKDISFIETVARQMLSTLITVMLVMLMLSLVAAFVVTRISLEPLVDVARQTRNISENNLAPIRYKGADDELGMMVHVLNKTIARLGDSINAQKVFLAEASHELRTPLTVMRGYLSRVEREVPEKHKQIVQDSLRVANNMTRLVNDLLQLSRGEIHESFTPHFVDLEQQLMAMRRDFPGLKVECQEDMELVGDPDRLMQVWRNLVSNAERITEDIGKVEIKAYQELGSVIIDVIDRGPGIPDHEKERIFEKFYKGSGKKGGSAGLGLTICMQIVQHHKGTISVLDTAGGGATFRVNLPSLDEES